MKLALATATLLWAAGCGSNGPGPDNATVAAGSGSALPPTAVSPDVKPAVEANIKKDSLSMSTNHAVQLRILSTKPGKPPLRRYIVEAVIDNSGKQARWFAIPTSVPASVSASGDNTNGAGADSLRAFEGSANGLVTMLGTGGVYALKVAAGAHVTITNLEVRSFSEDGNPPTTIAVRNGTDLSVGGSALSKWVSTVVENGTTLDASANTIKVTEWDGEQPLSFDDLTLENVAVAPSTN